MKIMFYCYKMQVQLVGFQPAIFFPPKVYSNYAIQIFLKEMMEISHFYIVIKSKIGVDFDVPHDVPQRFK
jgi:hypothetical protein